MRGQPNRLAAETAGSLAGAAIDRNQPLQFRLDGRTVNGFAGDTVLSAVLASGIDTVGRRDDSPLALSSRFAPAIISAPLAKDQQRALAMERTWATDGADYVTLARSKRRALANGVRGLLAPSQSLGLDLQRSVAMGLPWTGSVGAPQSAADLIVVGGGTAGMSAALAAAEAGLSVMLLEASPRLGGCAGLFGTLDGEETADASYLRLGAAIAGSDAITVLTCAAVFAVRPGAVRAHITEMADTVPWARVADLRARHIILATGASERLPLFAGNRLPGTVGVREAYELAQHYGVWNGQSALFATTSSAAYRLAMLARDAGIAVPRIIDARPQPQSRFIEYSKAYGITLAAGTIIKEARPGPRGHGLSVTPQLSMADFVRTEPELMADTLVVCGGWQPELGLWHMAGGTSHWETQTQRLVAGPAPQGVAVAGNAAGYLGHSACMASGRAAVDAVLGRSHASVSELTVDSIYETADAPAPVAPEATGRSAPCYLDSGRGMVSRPASKPLAGPSWRQAIAKAQPWSLADAPQALEAPEIAAGVQIGALPAESAGQVAQERVGMVPMAPDTDSETPPATDAAPPLVPPFLAGRFGSCPQVWLITPTESRLLETGALIQPDGDGTDPLAAIGVVLGQAKGGAYALIAASHAATGRSAWVREAGRAIPVRLVATHRVEAELAGALS